MEEIIPNYKKLLKKVPAFIFLVDNAMKIRYLNRVVDNGSVSDLIGHTVRSIFPQEEEYKKIETAIHGVFSTGETAVIDIHLDNPRWRRRWLTSHLLPYEDEKTGEKLVLGLDYDNSRLVEANNIIALNEQKLRSIIHGTTDDIMVINKDLEITFHNKVVQYPEMKHLVIGKNILDFLELKDRARIKSIYDKVINTKEPEEYEMQGNNPRKGWRWYQGSCSGIQENGVITELIIQTRDITAKKLEELKIEEFNQKLEELVQERTQELENANKEISVLLQEMHHRVKNNLQLVSSLLNIQSAEENEEVQNALLQSKNRIQSISLVHEMLYQNDHLAEIGLTNYLHSLIENQMASFRSSTPIKWEIDTSPQFDRLNIENMVPLGLLLNELITNSLKHGFNNTIKHPTISVEVNSIKDAPPFNTRLVYKDNGVGLHSKDKTNKKGIGQELIQSFAEQLDGKLTITPPKKGMGVYYTLLFNVGDSDSKNSFSL